MARMGWEREEGRGERGDGRWEMEERRCVVNDGGERSDQSRLLGADFCVEPGAGVGPVTFGGALGNAQQRSGFSNGHANEVAEFDQVGFLFVFRSEFFQGVIDGQEVVTRRAVGRRRGAGCVCDGRCQRGCGAWLRPRPRRNGSGPAISGSAAPPA